MRKNNYFLNFTSLSKLCLIVACLFMSSGAFSADITTGLVLHYTFDAVTGTNVPDDSGTGNVGTLMGAPTVVPGYSGQGVNFLTKADYISLPANFNVGLTSFTYATWVNLAALKNATRFFDFGNGADATNNFLAFIPSYNGDNGFMCLRYRPSTGTAQNVLSTVKIPVGAWAHIALTYTWDATTTTGTATIYLNGAAVGTATGLTYSLDGLGTTADNYFAYSRWGQDLNGFGGMLDDVRFYNRALSPNDILTLNGLAELNKQYSDLSLGDLTAVTSNLTLPTVLGTSGVNVRWASSNPEVIDSLGVVSQPAVYDATVKLTAILSQLVGDKTYTMTKIFSVKVPGIAGTPDKIAEWNFKSENILLENDTLRVIDIQSGFTGKLMNEARIRTIGKTEKINVLDLGNGKGYFDMGAEIGKAIYSLNDYTMMGFYRIDENYTGINNNGNFYWTFSNTPDAMTDKNGYIIGSLKGQSQSVSTSYYSSGNQATGPGTNSEIGGWHHFAYVQKGNLGEVFVDGASLGTNTAMTNTPSSIALAGRTGTLFNWLGRSNYVSDVYLQKTLLYDFQVLSLSLTQDDLKGFDGFDGVQKTLDKLNFAYSEDPDYTAPELSIERDNLTLADLSAVKTNITLPVKGLDQSIDILWKSSNTKLITATGEVTRPDYYNYNDTLTATLTKNGQSLTKKFPATVIVKDGTQFANDLLVKYDFSSVTDSVVTDAAEKHFKGTLKNHATVQSIGTSIKYKVLSLGDSIGYFDLGPEVGKLMYHMNDFTLGAYFRIDAEYQGLSKNGNFLWNFSNSKDISSVPTGYVIASLRNQAATISPTNYNSEKTVALADSALKNGWHHFAYTQSGTTGTIYIDGAPINSSDTITSLPSTALPKADQLGTLYNWIGRSCYASDVNLRKTLIYDFRLYKIALNPEQIQNTVLNVGNVINSLENAYAEGPTAVGTITDSKYKVIPGTNRIDIFGLNGTEMITLFDVAGSQLKITNSSSIPVNTGVYILRINSYVTKVMVK